MTFNGKLINDILEAIGPLPERFGLEIEDDEPTEPIFYEEICSAIHDVDEEAYVRFGMSKMVIISPNIGDVVIKIPFNGCFFVEYDEDDQCNSSWSPFIWSPAAGSKSDYCLAEWQKFKRLKTYGLDCFVAKTYFYRELCGTRIFLQERVIPLDDVVSEHHASAHSLDVAKQWYYNGKSDIEPDWLAVCLDKYHQSKVERFLHYCSNIDLDILEDLHDSNIGYRINGTPCILDYSNFAD